MKVTPITDTVHMVTGTNVNWALVTEGDAVTVVDTGYPNDASALLVSLEAIGRRPEDVVGILLTHAHLDHMGGVPALQAKSPDAAVHTGAEEARHARREYLDQITVPQMVRQCTRRAGRRWVRDTVKAVVPHAKMALREVTEVEPGVALDLPGAPVPIASGGHTPGHTAWLFPQAGVLCTGDALVTGHPLSVLGVGPQLLPSVFNHDEPEMLRALDELATQPADVLLPGHGLSLRGEMTTLVQQARDARART